MNKLSERFLYRLKPSESFLFVSNIQLSILHTYRQALKGELLDPLMKANNAELGSEAYCKHWSGFGLGLNALSCIVLCLEDWAKSKEYLEVEQFRIVSGMCSILMYRVL